MISAIKSTVPEEMWGEMAAKLDQPVGRDNWSDDDAEEFDLMDRDSLSRLQRTRRSGD
jgi:hypothetical protein